MRPWAELAVIRGYSAKLSRIIVSSVNTLITKQSFIAVKLETIFIFPFIFPTHGIKYFVYVAKYLLATDDEYSVH